MNSKGAKTNIKLISVVLIVSILMQLLMPIVIPLKSFAAEAETDYEIKTQIATVRVTSPKREIKGGEDFPVEVEIIGSQIVALEMYLKYDQEIFEMINIDSIETNTTAGWDAKEFEDQGDEGLYIKAYNQKGNALDIESGIMFTIRLIVKDTVTEKIDLTDFDIYAIPSNVTGPDYGPDGMGYPKIIKLPVPLKGFDIIYNANAPEGKEDTDVIEVPEAGKKTEGEPYTIATAPKLEGYRFMGWNTSADGQGGDYAPGKIYTADAPLTLYAQWKQVKIKYEANGENVQNMPDPVEENKTEDTYTITSTKPERAGFRFIGWNTVADGTGVPYKEGNGYTLDEDLTLYAQWEEITESAITYEANGANVDLSTMPENAIKEVGIDYTISAQIPQREGYEFKGWNEAPDGTKASYEAGRGVYTKEEPLTLYAQWEKITPANITYEANGENVDAGSMPANEEKIKGQDYTISAKIPTRPGYKFISWNTSANGTGTTQYPSSIYTKDEDLTLYAQWKEIKIKYEANADTDTVENLPPEEAKTEENYTISTQVPTREGYEFKNWNTKADGTGITYDKGVIYTADESLTLYAQWEKVTPSNIVYNANGADVDSESMPQNETKAKGEDYTISTKVPTRSGYEFKGWNTAEDGSGISYPAGTKYKVDEDLTLYAQWQRISTIDIIYDKNVEEADKDSVTGMPDNATKEEGNDYIIGNAPTRAGYRFMGWNTAKLGTGGNYPAGSVYSIDASLTLYAQWKQEYTLTINPDGGDYTGDTQVKGIQDEIAQISTPTVTENQKGYTITLNMNDETGATETIVQTKSFDKWQLETGKGNVNDATFTFADGDATIKAIYKLDEVSLKTPTRAGYTFKGWYTNANIEQGEKVDIPYIPDADAELFAQWEENAATTVEIIYDKNVNPEEENTVENMPPTATINKGDTHQISAEPTRTGYIFKGWNVAKDGTQLMYQPGNTYKAYEDLKLYAIWEEVTSTDVTITYKANVPDAEIGTVQNLPAPGTKAEGATYEIATAEPTRDGYKFIEWNMSETGDEAGYKPGDKYKTHSNLILYAIWEKEYTLTINPDGGTYTEDQQIKGIKDEIKQISIPTAPEGHTVIFNMNDGTENPEQTQKKQAKTFEKWELETGKGNISGTTYTFADGDAQIKAIYKLNEVKLEIPTRAGYSFKGWYTDADPAKGQKVEMPFIPEADVTLYAIWEEDDAEQFTLTIKANGGKYVGETERTGAANAIIQIGEPSEAPKGHKIVINPNNGTGTLTEVQQTQSFDRWEKTSGEGTINGTVFTFGETAAEVTAQYRLDKVELGTPEKLGYEIEGWYTTTNSTLDPETDTKIDDPENYVPTRDETVYPNWKEKEYKIIYNNTKDSDNSENPTKYTVSTQTLEFKNLADQERFTFKGWYLTEDGTGEKVTIINVADLDTFEDIQLYAQWEQKPEAKVEITYDANVEPEDVNTVENMPATATVNNGEAYTIGARPTRAGYTFKGWNVAKDGTQLMYQPGNTYKAYEDLKLYAIWEKESSTEVEIIYSANVPDAEIDTVKDLPEKGTKPEGTDYTIAAAPTRDGYRFTGWNMSKDGDEAGYQPGSKYKTDANLTLFAQWEKEYTLTVNPNGGTYTGETSIKGIKDEIKQVVEPTGAPKGHTVTLNMNYQGGATTTVEQTQTFEKWEKVTGEGSVEGAIFTFAEGNAEIKAIYKLDEVNLEVPTREGYIFKGWYTTADPAQGEKVDMPFTPEENVTLYANWEKEPEEVVEYTLTIKPNGGIYEGDTEIKGANNTTKQIGLPTQAPKGHKIIIDPNNGTDAPTEVQQTQSFDKWEKTSGEGTVNGTVFTFGEGNAEVTAKYKLDKVELGTPEKRGYEIEGWYTTSTPTANPNPETDTKIDPENYVPTKDEKVYVNWKEKEYKIIYNNIDNIDNSKNPIKYTIKDQKIELEDLPDQEKYIFKGWYATEDGTGEKITSIDITKLEKMEDIQLYAKWEEKEPESEVLYLESEKYKVGEKDIDKYEKGDVYLDKIEPETTVAKLKENCDHNGTLTVINAEGQVLNDNDLVGTDMIIRVEGHNDKIELTAVVMGDLDGNGKVTATDLSALKQSILKEIKLEGASFKAADLDDNENITATDLSTINNTILKNITLTYSKN